MQGLGEGIFRLLFFSVPGMVIVALVFPISFSASITTWILFFVSLLFSFIVNTQINLLTGIMAFFLLNNTGLIRAKRVVIDLFSGLLLPISFYPLWAHSVMTYLPFQAISYIPSMIFTEGFVGAEVYNAVMLQAAWAIILWIPIRFLWSIAKRQLIVQGG
jgi:ABC-2 type transport system permease protein